MVSASKPGVVEVGQDSVNGVGDPPTKGKGPTLTVRS